MIVKLIGACLTIFSFTALGFYFSNELKVRLAQLKELKKYITILRGDIRYGSTPLPEALHGIAVRSPGVFQNFFYKVSEQLYQSDGGTFQEVWGRFVERELKETSLHQRDKDNLTNLGDNLGYLDREMQINTIDLYLAQLQEEINDQTIVVKERTKIYNVLGLMAGLFITIIMM